MQKIKVNIINFKEFFIGLLIISIPFLEFIKTNYYSLDVVMFKNILSYFITSLIFYFIFYVIINKIVVDKENILKYILTISIFFWLLFKFENIQNFLFSIGIDKLNRNNLSAEIALIIILLICFLFLNKTFTKISLKFLIFFFLVQHLFVYAILIKNYLSVKFDQKNNTKILSKLSNNYFSNEELELIKNSKNRNIYYLVIDEMTSLEEYNNLGGKENINNWKIFFEKYGYVYVPKTYSTFNDTNTTFGSIFYLNPIVLEGSNISDDEYTELTYPTSLSEHLFSIGQFPRLIKILNNINYEFKWIGNGKYNCNNYNQKLCIEFVDEKNDSNNFFLRNINFYVLKIFLQNTPLEELYKILKKKIKSVNSIELENSTIHKDDAIKKFISKRNKYYKKNNLYFYFLHDHLFKEPYPFNENCNKIMYSNDDKDIKINIHGYLKIYQCIIKKINKLIIYLDTHDPEAIVIIQGDHGFRAPYKDIRNPKKYEMFNLIKVNDNCRDKISNIVDNVNSARLAISCATSTIPRFIKKQTHYSSLKKEKNSKIIEIKIKQN